MTRAWIAAVATVVLVAAGCGGSEDTPQVGDGGSIIGAGGAGGTGAGGTPGTGGDIGTGGTVGTGGSGGDGGSVGTGGTPGTGGDGGSGPSCGDGVANGEEDCDGTDLRGQSCTDFDFDGGVLGCSFDCSWDTSDCFHVEICDDGIDNDGDGDVDCDDADCFDDIDACPRCGDGVINGDDVCDGEAILTTCEAEGFSHGTVACSDACEIDLSGCVEFEVCDDGIDNDGDGDIDCDDSDCFDDIDNCPRCGDGVINGDDVCDGEAILTTCEDQDFSHGTIGCTDSCELDLSGCVPFEVCDDGIDNDGDGDTDCDDSECVGHFECPSCGDGTLQRGEECEDGIALTASCGTFGFNSGDLGCNGCLYDLTDCHNVEMCGNGIDDDGDGDVDCDDSDCDQVAPCPVCGNGVVEDGEECDDNNLDDGDGCSSSCVIEPWYVAQTVGDTSSRSGSIDTTDPQYTRLVGCGSPSSNAPNYYDVYYLENPGAGAVDVRVQAAWGADGYLFAYTNFDPVNQTVGCIEGNDDYNSTSSASAVHATVPGNGGIYIVATSFSANAAIGAYTLTAHTLHVCGDGVVGGNEFCDFGDANDGDGCSSSCQLEAGWVCDDTGCRATVCGDGVVEGTERCETGPNCDANCQLIGDTCDNAIEVTNLYDPSTASLTITGDTTGYFNDYGRLSCSTLTGGVHPDMVYTFTAPATGTYTFDMITGSGFDDLFWVTTETCGDHSATVACMDTGSDTADLAAGDTVYVVITAFGSTKSNNYYGPFTFNVDVETCGDGVVKGAETCDLGSTPNAGCVDCQVQPGWACDDTTCWATVCGDGIMEGTEQCDDGNIFAGDGCSATCEFEGDTCADAVVITDQYLNPATSTWTVVGDTTGYNADYNHVTSGCGSSGGEPDMVLAFTAPGAGDYTFDLLTSGTPYDDLFYVWTGGCGMGNTEIACKDTGSQKVSLAANEDVYVVVTGYGATFGDDFGPFTLTIAGQYCGNGKVELAEECDVDHPGCVDCRFQPGWACDDTTCWETTCGDGVVEGHERCEGGPNCNSDCQLIGDTCDTAIDVTNLYDPTTSSLTITGDSTGYFNDYGRSSCSTLSGGVHPDMVYTFTAPATGTYTFDMDTPSGFDDLFWVTTETCGDHGATVACMDTGSDTAELEAGDTVYVVATGYGSSTSSSYYGPFTLSVDVQACGDGVVKGEETCDLGSAPHAGCVDCQIQPGFDCDATTCWNTVCGDGVLEHGEECDDSNTTAGDGCDANCQWEASTCADAGVIDDVYFDAATATWTVRGDTTTKGVDFGPAGCSSSGSEPDMVFSFVAPELGTYEFEVYDHPSYYDDMLFVWSGACGTGSNEIACVDTGATSAVLQAGEEVYVVVTGYNSSLTPDNHGPFALDIRQLSVCGDSVIGPNEGCDFGDFIDGDGCSATCQVEAGYMCDTTGCWTAVCGNDMLEPGESCDDGNLNDGDGCDGTCELETIPAEVEPNNDVATAQPLGNIGAVTGGVSPAGEKDYYSVQLLQGATYFFETSTGLDGSCSSTASHDTELRIRDAANTQLAFDQDGGNGYCSRLLFQAPTTDTYYVEITSWSGTTAVPVYYLWWGPQ